MASTVADGRRTLVALTAALVLAGIGMSVTSLREIGSVLTVAALLSLIAALHRYGRSGPDAPLRFDAPRPKAKSKKRKKKKPAR